MDSKSTDFESIFSIRFMTEIFHVSSGKGFYTEADIKGRQVEAEGSEIFCLYARIGFSHKRSHVAHRK